MPAPPLAVHEIFHGWHAIVHESECPPGPGRRTAVARRGLLLTIESDGDFGRQRGGEPRMGLDEPGDVAKIIDRLARPPVRRPPGLDISGKRVVERTTKSTSLVTIGSAAQWLTAIPPMAHQCSSARSSASTIRMTSSAPPAVCHTENGAATKSGQLGQPWRLCCHQAFT